MKILLVISGLLIIISPFVNIGYSKLYYYKLFVTILLVIINAYSIGAYIFY